MLIINLLAFTVSALDKWNARRHTGNRTPEKHLFALALLGGGAGLYASMLLLRHKTRHWYFMVGVPAIIVLEAAGCAALWYFFPALRFW